MGILATENKIYSVVILEINSQKQEFAHRAHLSKKTLRGEQILGCCEFYEPNTTE